MVTECVATGLALSHLPSIEQAGALSSSPLSSTFYFDTAHDAISNMLSLHTRMLRHAGRTQTTAETVVVARSTCRSIRIAGGDE